MSDCIFCIFDESCSKRLTGLLIFSKMMGLYCEFCIFDESSGFLSGCKKMHF
ncbi:hypothetical protein HanPI659440_Chr01g0024721 [Helianthus annuus]|nr:hypothetical protein HanPI659440_Chr01g0024721 [Helianthus annuus]